MKISRRLIKAVVLLIICIIIHLYSASESRVEEGYSVHFFKNISHFLRYIFGWLPFSVGDILYGIAFIWIIVKLIKAIKYIFSREKKKIIWKDKLAKAFFLLTTLYIIFNIFWGINYNRKGIAWQLELNMKPYTTDELKDMNALLVQKVNTSKASLINLQQSYPSNKQLFLMVENAYKNIENQPPYLQYQPPSIKSSLWGWIGNYTGFSGYCNPFTGEAQVNTTIPKFSQPFTACHEVAHQLGYAKEMEANFVGYLAASASKDTLFQYSVYLDLFSYANRNLFAIDSLAAKKYSKQLSPPVVADIREWIAFSRSHQSPVEPVIRWLYGKYLESNKQPQGIYSYDEVTGFIIAYYKKFGRI
ncbi:MAG: DUF3810 domain-containing protein [Ferruginibacter sp.]